MVKPNLFLIGAPKSGTTALAYNLAQHKDIFLPELKEPRFFDAHVFYDREKDYPIKTIDEYLSLFQTNAARSCKYRIDASVFNMYSMKSIEDILGISPEAKFVIVLREPVSASASMHKQRLKYPRGGMREVSSDFIECWRLLDRRKNGDAFPKDCVNKFLFRYDLMYSYELYIPELIKRIPKGQLHIAFYDDYRNQASRFYRSLFDFLELHNVPVENKVRNDSVFYKDSSVLGAVFWLARITLPLRRVLGINGDKVKSVKRFILDRFEQSGKLGESDFSEVEHYFDKTNKYLAELKEKYR